MIKYIIPLLFIELLYGINCPICGHILFQERGSEIGKDKYECLSGHIYYFDYLDKRKLELNSNQAPAYDASRVTPKPMTKKDAYATMGAGFVFLAGVAIVKGIKKLKENRASNEVTEFINIPKRKTEGELYWESKSPEEKELIIKKRERFRVKALILVTSIWYILL